MVKSPPDFIYDPLDWEATYMWDDRDTLTGDDLRCDSPRQYATLLEGPPVWAVEVVLYLDDRGDPDETEVQWFDNLADAQAAGDTNRPKP